MPKMGQQEDNSRLRLPVTIGQVGEKIMRYWPALFVAVLVIAAGTEVRLVVGQHTQALKEQKETAKINFAIIMAKLEADDANKAQWRLLRSLVEDNVKNDGRLKQVEKHITPTSIQLWGQIQATVIEDHADLKNHLRGHP